MTSGASATNSAAYLRMRVGIARAPADSRSARCGRSVQPNCSSACRNAAMRACDSGSSAAAGYEHADAPHALGLLRARRERPRTLHHQRHREIPAASCPPPGSGDGIVAAQTECFDRGQARLRDAARCPLWVISRHEGLIPRCPLYPQKRTWSRVLPEGPLSANSCIGQALRNTSSVRASRPQFANQGFGRLRDARRISLMSPWWTIAT